MTCCCHCSSPHPRTVPPLLEGRNGSSSPPEGGDVGGCGLRSRGSSSERSAASLPTPAAHQLWDGTSAELRTPPSVEALALPESSLSQQLRPTGAGVSNIDSSNGVGSTASAPASEMRASINPGLSTSQRQLEHLREQPASSAAAAVDAEDAVASGGASSGAEKMTPAVGKHHQHQHQHQHQQQQVTHTVSDVACTHSGRIG